ncbi:MAG: hypothetical protein KGO23_05090, partial [Nitrospirota bacterium]|nr:hypothetical protein [Nitrospirota bacterium]
QTLNVPKVILECRKRWRGFSVRRDPFKVRTAHTKCELCPLALHSLRPCWTAYLNILRGILTRP